MKKAKPINLCIIGAGRVGTTTGYFFSKKPLPGINLKSISSRSEKSINRAKKILGAESKKIIFTNDNIKAALYADCVLICTPDDVIGKICRELTEGIRKADAKKNIKNYHIIHFSGAKSLEVLKPAREAGAKTASVHPLKSFASIKEAIKTLPGTVYGLTFSCADSKKVAEYLIKNLGGEIIEVEDEKKPLYHAAACVASNYLVTLLNYAVLIHKKIGIRPEDSLKGLMSLVDSTLGNIKKMGTEKSLTGPIARGDTGTIKEHISGFKKFFPDEDVRLYKIMGIETSRIAYGNDWIKDSTVRELKKILKG